MPEVIEEDYDIRCDIYSLGVVILKMISDMNREEFMKGKDLKDTPNITQITLRFITLSLVLRILIFYETKSKCKVITFNFAD